MLKRKKQIIAKVMATTMLASTLASTFVTTASAAEAKATVNSSTILAGADRYETAIKISENGWSSATNAVLINGETGLVDALTATPYASLKNAPILITHKDNLTPATLTRLKAMNVKNVDIVGGVNSVSENVVNQLKANGMTVNRIAGSSRYETGLEVAKAMDKISDVSKIAVVNGEKGLPDAVSVAAPAADNKMPIILAHPTNGLDAATKTFINGESISKSYVIGSTTSIPDSIANSLPGTKTRLGGTDRHDTNAKVIKEFYTQKELDNIYVAKSGYVNNDTELVDALAAGVLAAKNDDPVLIVGKTLGSTQESLLKDKSFTKITQIGGNIPTATIEAIKDTQKDPEATVSGVTLVNYKTIKITGKELNRIDKSKVSISGNTTSSYTVNSAGTEATVEFANAFNNGTNTVKVTSNLGNTTSHTFIYNSQISSVEATTSEIGTGANGTIQYLEFTVNGGQKRTVEELKALGWKVEFKSSDKIFYNGANSSSYTSLDGKLRTNTPFEENDVYDYEVILTKDSEKIKSGLKAFRVVDKSVQYKEIKSFDIKLNNDVKITSNKLVVGETADLVDLEVVDADNNTSKLSNADSFIVTSSNPAVVSVNSGSDKNKLNANSVGTAEITIKGGTATKKFTITVVSDARKVSTVSLSKSKIYLSKGQIGEVEATVKDQYGDAFKGYELIGSEETIKSGDENVATINKTDATNEEGKVTITINASDVSKNLNGSLSIKEDDKTIATLYVYVSTAIEATSWKLENEIGKDNILDLYTPTGKEDDNILNLTLNGYNGSYLIGEVKETIDIHESGTISKTGYVVTSTNSSVAKITKAENGEITVTALKEGNATIKLYKNGSEKSSFSVTVKDSTPKITEIFTKSVDTIDEANEEFNVIEALLNLTEISTTKIVVSGLTISGTAEEVLIGYDNNDRAVLYVEKEGEGYNKDKDLLLATIDVSTDFGAEISEGIVAIESNKTGNIIVKIFRGEYPEDTSNPSNPFKVELIKVNTSN